MYHSFKKPGIGLFFCTALTALLHDMLQTTSEWNRKWLWFSTFEKTSASEIFFPLNTSRVHFPCWFILCPPHWVCFKEGSQGLLAFWNTEIELSRRTVEGVPRFISNFLVLWRKIWTALKFTKILIIMRDMSPFFWTNVAYGKYKCWGYLGRK